MFIIAVVSQKGGSGKTTLSGHLSVQAHLSGDGPVAIIDTDPQGSLAAWWNEREDENPIFVQTTMRELHGHLESLRQAGVRQVVIDTPPAITAQIHEVIRIADYVVVPTKPSPHDLRAVGATVKLVQSCSKPMVFVLNDASPRAKITYEAAIALSQHGTVAPVTVHHRTLFASSMIDGRTAMELQPSGQSAAEITGLWEYLNARLHCEVLPTSIGLDALNRRDGSKKVAAHFAADDLAETDPFDDDLDGIPAEVMDDNLDDFEDAAETQTARPAAAIVKGALAKPAAVAAPQPAAALPAASAGGAADPDLWAGFAAEPNTTHRPEPAPRAGNSGANGGTGGNHHPEFGRRTRVFGRRQAV